MAKWPKVMRADELTDDVLLDHAADLMEFHQLTGTFARVLCEDEWILRLLGEREYSRITSFPVNTEICVCGDGGVDFVSPNGTEIDVKTASVGLREVKLLAEVDKPHCECLVLARADVATMTAELLGWLTFAELIRRNIKEPGKGGKHYNWRQYRQDLWLMNEHWPYIYNERTE